MSMGTEILTMLSKSPSPLTLFILNKKLINPLFIINKNMV